jgi:hypothetical protein
MRGAVSGVFWRRKRRRRRRRLTHSGYVFLNPSEM